MLADHPADRFWHQALSVIETRGWKSAEAELARVVASLELLGPKHEEQREGALLVLATLQQKFGQLPDATATLKRLSLSRHPAIALDSTVRLGKVLSQQGKFTEAGATFESILPTAESKARWSHDDTLSPSVLWRLGFLKGINKELKESQYWLSRHRDMAPRHGSQSANNMVFQNLVRLVSDERAFVQAHESNQVGLDHYLRDALSVENVKYVNVSKSVVVPLLLDGVILLSFRSYFAGVLQLLLCRRLLQFEGITVDAEGVAEVVTCLKRLPDNLPRALFARLEAEERPFTQWLTRQFQDRQFVEYLVGERERIFAEFTDTRNYMLLSVFEKTPGLLTGSQRGKTRMTKKKVFIIHGHDELNLLRLKDHLMNQLGITPVILSEVASKGKTLIEKFEAAAPGCDYAFALFSKDDQITTDGKEYLQARPNVIFELGWFYGKLGRSNVTILFQEGVNIPSDLDGIVRIQFRDNVMDKVLQIERELA